MGVPVAVGVIVGLAASFVQSLGLTIQRLSHLSNEKLAPDLRKRDWQRPLWLFGLAIFLVSNVAGTLFQIGTLPLVVLGPLGAVSLVCNALFARLLLGDAFSVQLAVGSALIATGATLVGIFGTVPEQTHTLPELVALYRRPAFLVWLAVLSVALSSAVGTAHVAEWRLERRLADLPPGTPKLGRRRQSSRRRTRRWSYPSLTASSTTAHRHNNGAGASERAPLLPPADSGAPAGKYREASTRFSARIDPVRPRALEIPPPVTAPTSFSIKLKPSPLEEVLESAERTRLWLAIAYGATSGSLSGLCLLFTKTGMDLVIQTLVNRNNQFGHLEAWALLIVLLVCELAQLSYLNRALRLVGPTLVCPTAFCFYNAASILSGLIYYRQLDALRPLQGVLIALGSAILLGGVWIVSVKPVPVPVPENQSSKERTGGSAGEREDGDVGSGLSMDEMGDESADSDDDLVPYRPRGFSIGISAASPGFEIRPSVPRRGRHSLDIAEDEHGELAWSTNSLPAPTSPSAAAAAAVTGPSAPLDSPRTPGGGRRARRSHRRDDSLTGAPYVGPRLPPSPPLHSTVLSFSEEPDEYAAGSTGDDGLGAAPVGNFQAAAGRRKESSWWPSWTRRSRDS